ncbi:MAG: putative molybdenum carrier protein [Elusimicrobiota bacterium]
MHKGALIKVISGGQTGVDRGALDAAIELGLPCGGAAPKGRRAEDGRIPDRYPVVECASSDYSVRTERNVIGADATLILCPGEPTGGTRLTGELARRHGKPVCVVDIDGPEAAGRAREFLLRVRPKVLNVAGPRESSRPGIALRARVLLLEALGDVE